VLRTDIGHPCETRSLEIPGGTSAKTGFNRPRVNGKFLYLGGEKLWVRGVTYGPFRPQSDGSQYPSREVVERDFTQIAGNGLNAIRTYTVPPSWLLDAAERHGLHVMIGLPWEQHIAFLDDRSRTRDILERVRDGVRACAGHPAILCYAIGNEIPAPIVRWHGHRRVEQFLGQLYQAAKIEDPEGLVTYVNYPSTEYLQLPFVDIVCFNVYLESQEPLAAYLSRLHNLAGDRPLMMTEIGLDSRRHGVDTQAQALDWQIRTAFAAGSAGVFVFAWTDEWHRGGYAIEDWDFGLTDRDRHPKTALAAVREAVADVPFPSDISWPRVSVIVCSCNGARTIRDCFDGLLRLEYPNYEVIVVNDGSNDRTAGIAQEYGFRLITTANRGLSSARNTGLAAATGEIVAYIDDDAYPDTHWLKYLVGTFLSIPHAGIGGPNIPPPGDGSVAECVAIAPGGPTHVLLSDRVAEHIPGCNMAFRKDCLEAIGGFDPQFRAAGDDVDVCWRLQERGWSLGFSPAAVVWHHRRNSVGAYWKQQRGYGKAEAMLERKWPQKYNAVGHVTWAGRIYSGGGQMLAWRRGRINYGTWGTALFQSIYQPANSFWGSIPQMPEWYLVLAMLGALSVAGSVWWPLRVALPLCVLGISLSLLQAGLSATRACFTNDSGSRLGRLKLRCLVAWLHLLQPLARLSGRLWSGLTPWRSSKVRNLVRPRSRVHTLWEERWRSSAARLESVEAAIRADGMAVRRGGDFDRWDLEVRGGALGAVRLRLAIEEHGGGRQLVRFRSWPRCLSGGLALTVVPAVLSAGAAITRAWVPGLILGVASLLVALRVSRDCAAATGALLRALRP
jgi:GT2 family glycosyltransferase